MHMLSRTNTDMLCIGMLEADKMEMVMKKASEIFWAAFGLTASIPISFSGKQFFRGITIITDVTQI